MLSVLVMVQVSPRETEPIEYTGTHIHTYIHTGIYYKELAHTVMEVKKSHDLPSAIWKPRKARDVIQSES